MRLYQGVRMALLKRVCATDPPAVNFCVAGLFIIERIKLIHE